MPKSEGQKLKLLYLADLLRRETDEDHALSMSDILSRLEELGVHAERKSIYDDLRALEDYGMDIIGHPRPSGWLPACPPGVRAAGAEAAGRRGTVLQIPLRQKKP